MKEHRIALLALILMIAFMLIVFFTACESPTAPKERTEQTTIIRNDGGGRNDNP